MAKPRVFVSSTYYDLKHVRSSLDLFIESLGFEPVLSEKGNIAYTPDTPLDDSCYREAATADIFVIIIGGRYGTEASSKRKTPNRTFFDRYESITKKEYESALDRDIPVYVLVESNVYSEYQTYLRNKDNQNITYAHVDSVNVFRLIEEILSKPRNNPTHTFERFAEIESWLRDQWAGFFRELLQKQSQQQQLSTLGAQVSELKAVNETLRKYLEAVMTGITPDDSNRLIESEQRRLHELERNERIKENRWCRHVTRRTDVSFDTFIAAMREATSFLDFTKRIAGKETADNRQSLLFHILQSNESARRDFNDVRKLLELKPLRLRKSEVPSTEEPGSVP
ncbi:MAG: DUF4062 domain-containing protein [Kiritimatiellales bacterium]|nr:DUF4062 domain-containing protein [Kiritimatiellales bacterium]